MSRIIKNRDVLQSYLITTAKYDFNIYEKRILYRIVETFQYMIEGKKLNSPIRTQVKGDDMLITMPISAFLINEKDENYTRVKIALTRLRNKTFEFDNGKSWKLIGIIEKPSFDYAGMVQFELQKEVYTALMDFSKGFRKYELKIAMQFESVYSMRFYELMSGKKEPITYTIDYLKELFCLQSKYKLVADFRRYVLDVSKKELDRCSPYTFDYVLNKTGRSYTSVTLYPKFQIEHRDEGLETSYLQRKQDTSWYLAKEEKEYLIQNIGFTRQGIKNNAQLFEDIKSIFVKNNTNLIEALADIKTRGLKNGAKNIQGYTIKTLKSILEHQDEPICLKSSKNARKGESKCIGDLLKEYKK